MLPAVPFKRRKVELADGIAVEVRELTQEENILLAGMHGDPDAASLFLIARGTDTPEDDARAWRASSPAAAADRITKAVAELSGLMEGAQKSGGARTDDG